MRSLNDPVTMLAGVGAKRADSLASLGIQTIEDLLTYYPFRYEDIQERNLNEILDQEKVTLKGLVVSPPVMSRFGYKKNRLQFRMMQDHAVFNVSFFNQPYLKDKVILSEEIAVYGKWDAKRKSLNGMKILGSQAVDDFSPIYHVNKSIRQTTLVDLIRRGFEEYGDLIEENLPNGLVEKYRLLDRPTAVKSMHFPKNHEENHQAKRRIVFEEFFLFQMRLQGLKKSEKAETNGIEILYKGKVRRAYKWDEMRTHRIVYMGKGTLRNSEDFWCDVKACVVFSTRRIKDSFFQSPFPFEAWNEQISGVCLLFPGVAMLVAMAVWFFRKRRVVKIYLDNRESFSKDNIYYSSVNKKYFLQKMKEWHVELEDNKPEEIPPWKEQI